jgi:pSer/pThr/pTyr-binding forkhead associated (FHA) protein
MSAENKTQTKKTLSLDWLIGGVLSKLGDMFDRLTGRKWNPSSSLATSKLTEKLKFLLDSEVRDLGKQGKFVPHEIKLKMQWDKFSADSEKELVKLEHELHAAAIDHINDKLYHTYAPMNIRIKTDYFTEGVRMLASFGKFSDKEDDEVAVNVTVPNLRVDDLISEGKITVNLTEREMTEVEDIFIFRYSAAGKSFEKEINFSEKKRISVGRSKENDLAINDQSVSKIHAALVLNGEKQLMVADTGSTNGTFIDGQRIAYGKAVAFEDEAILKFGTVEVSFERLNPVEEFYEEEPPDESEIRPTEAAVDVGINENAPPVAPTEAVIGGIENEIPASVNQNGDTGNIQPTRASVDVEEKAESDGQTDQDAAGEQSNTRSGFKTEAEPQAVNIDETQDWEI